VHVQSYVQVSSKQPGKISSTYSHCILSKTGGVAWLRNIVFFSHTQLTQSSTYSHHILSKTGGVAWLQNTVFFFSTLSLHNTEKQIDHCLIEEALIVDLMCGAAQS
jgi:hypothetical protein